MATTVDTLLVRIEADMSDLRRDLAKVAKTTEQHTNRMADGFRKVRNAVVAIGGTALFTSFIRGTIDVGAQIEGLEVQMNALLGSAEEGGKAFENMRQFASRVPFSLKQIQQGAGGLAAASSNADELGELLQLTGNIAAQFNLPFEEAAANVQRALSAGIGAADQFRDRGVSAFAGFEAGVSYSAAETARKLQDTFGTGGTADGAMDAFAKTTAGAMSMLGDAFFNAQSAMASSGLNEGFVELVNAVKELLNQAQPLFRMLGNILGAAFSFLARVIAIVTDNMDKLVIAIEFFVMLGLYSIISTLSAQFVKLARMVLINRNVFASLNKIIRRSPFLVLALGVGLAADQLGLLDAGLDKLEKRFPVFFKDLDSLLDPSARGGDDEGLDELNALLDKAASSPTRVELGGTDIKGFAETRESITDLIDSVLGGTSKLTENMELLKTVGSDDDLFAGAQSALQRLDFQVREQTEPAFSALVDASIAMGDSVQSAFRQMLDGTEITMGDFGEMIKSSVKDVIAQIFRLVVINQMLNAMFPGLGLKTSTMPEILGRAGGGSAYSNQPMLVGERGPELFVPHSAGSVMNNASSKGALGGGSTVVNQTINIETGVSQTVRAEMLSLLPVIKADTMNAVADQNRRGGSFRQALA